MNRVLGFGLLIVGAVLLYHGWQIHDATMVSEFSNATARAAGVKPVWMLGIGAVTAVWGLYALMLRPSP